MKTYIFILLMGGLVFQVASESKTYKIELGQNSVTPACPPYSEEAHELLKRFVASSLPHTAEGVTVESVSPSEIIWVEQHIRCENMIHDPESEMYLTFWKSNQYYFILVMHRNPVRWIDENTLDLNLGTDSINVYDLNLNRIRVFFL
ncbi:MAG: hypothetical protein LAT57_09305 [Balneolales bacterium]|nr:hypothetical protein [Balneolales bacterium]